MLEDEERFVLIDTDAGTDDAMAIFMCLKAHISPRKFKVVGITCLGGNTAVDNVTQNVTRILGAVGLQEIPVFRGSAAPIVFPYEDKLPPPPFHGYDGFGDVFEAPVIPKVEAENAVLAIIRLAHNYRGTLTILALGPHTNLAMAVRLDPTIKDCIRDMYGMAGNIEGVGNVTVCSEFNFGYDPEAAYITLSSYRCPIIIVPWEVCLRQATRPMAWRRDVLGRVNSPAVTLLNLVEQRILENKDWAAEFGGWVPCDQVAAAVLLNPDVIKQSVQYHCTVELGGRHTRGLMIVDQPNLLKERKNVTVISQIVPELLETVLLNGVSV